MPTTLTRALLLASTAYALPAAAQDAPPSTQATAAPNIDANRASDAPAQEAPLPVAAGDGEEVATGDIVVTAQKRSERLQDVPLAVTAITGDALANRQINDTANLVQAVPSLSFQQGNNPTNTSFRIRGVGTSLFGQGVESSVSVVVDGVVAARQAQSFTDFADIERVEVLRGPQGTLFGKNATAGVISVVTARPSFDFEAKGSITVAEGDEYRVAATASGPVSDAIRVRATGYYNDVGGHSPNLATGEDDNGFRSWGVRGKLEFDASESLNFLLAADYRKNDAQCCQGVLVKANNPARLEVSGPVTVSEDNDAVWNNGLTYANSKQQTYSLQADLDLGAAAITSITAYQKFFLDNNVEVDRFAFDVPVRIGPSAPAQFNLNRGTTDIKNFTQELRIASTGSRTFSYVAGAFYSNLELGRYFERRRALCAVGTIGQPCAAPTYQSLSHFATLKNDSIAAFGQAELQLFEKLKLIGGLRVQNETVSVEGQRFGPIVAGDGLFGPAASAKAKREASDTAITGKAAVQYQFSRRAQAYASYTRGYKGLGFDTEITADFANQAVTLPEDVDAYEIGFKGQSSDGTFSIAAAAFLADYTNLQIQANRTDPLLGAPTFVQTNAGSSRTKGFEIEATLRPSRDFTVNAAVTYAKSRVDVNGLGCPQQFQNTAASPTIPIGGTRPVNRCYRFQFVNAVTGATATSGFQQDVRGGMLPASPEWRVSVSPRWEKDLGANHRGFVQADVSFQSDQIFAIEQDPLLRQDAYEIVDLSIGLRQIDNRYSVTAFVKNLFDQNYYNSLIGLALLPANLTLVDLYANRPKNADRYFGASVGFQF